MIITNGIPGMVYVVQLSLMPQEDEGEVIGVFDSEDKAAAYANLILDAVKTRHGDISARADVGAHFVNAPRTIYDVETI